ncbi:MAG: beta-N-acetylhexosaminidase [Geminicoccaceae bacterium]
MSPGGWRGADPRAAVVGIAGPELDAQERELLLALPPAAVILFQRNCIDRAQLRALTDEIHALGGDRRLPVLIDQEGGRVMRLRPPEWRALPAAGEIGRLARELPAAAREAAWLAGRLIAHDLREVGIDVDCAPCLDVAAAGMTEAIGSRSYASDPSLVATLARSFADGLLAGGIAPVIKHLPGHGRATVDSHHALPVVRAAMAELDPTDFLPFAALRDLPFAMTCHVVFEALDPDRAATISSRVIAETIRGRLGVQGLLFSDDLNMEALAGDPASRAVAALEAGCDLALFCPGRLADNRAVLQAVPALAPSVRARLDGVLADTAARADLDFDAAAGERRLTDLLSGTPA